MSKPPTNPRISKEFQHDSSYGKRQFPLKQAVLLPSALADAARRGSIDISGAPPAPQDGQTEHTEHVLRTLGSRSELIVALHPEEARAALPALERQDEPYHLKPIEDIATELGSDLQAGLSSGLAAAKLEREGKNELEQPPRMGLFMLFLMQLTNLIILLLAAAAIASILMAATDPNRNQRALSYVEGIAIFIIVVLNAGIAAVSEHSANSALDALASMAQPFSKVIRDGVQMDVPVSSVVRGDIVMLETGDVVPADIRLIASADLKVNEMILTGEPEDVGKSSRTRTPKPGEVAKLTEDNMCFSTTLVKSGNGKSIVVHTGMGTRVGSIAKLLAGDQSEDKKKGCLPETGVQLTPLQVSLDRLGVIVGIMALAVCLVVFIVGVALNTKDPDQPDLPSWLYMILIGVTLAVAAIPEGIPLSVTIALATGSSDMVTKHVLVRKLAAVETLGSASVICTDKTGTLTEGKMTMTHMWTGFRNYLVTGKGFDPTVGEIKLDIGGTDADMGNVRCTLTAGVLCSNVELCKEIDPDTKRVIWNPKGNSSEAPIVVAAGKLGIWTEELCNKHPRIVEIPFSSSRKMMATVVGAPSGQLDNLELADGTKYIAAIKGAPNYILQACSKVLRSDGTTKDLSFDEKAVIMAKVDELSSQALRVLAIAYNPFPQIPYDVHADDDEMSSDDKLDLLKANMTLCGLVASIDPAREGVGEAVLDAYKAHMRVIMITGDYLKTAIAIAHNVNILRRDVDDAAVAAVDCGVLRPLNNDTYLPDAQFDAITANVKVFARAKPEDKLEIVKSLQRQGLVCAMTGDGVNDAPALKEADIGVAMGIQGTEVAKGASDMILTDDNFCSIVAAVEKGRVIYAGIQKFVAFIMSVHLAEVLQIFLCIASGLPVMRQPLQILFLVLCTDLPPAIALGMEPGDPTIMREYPRPKRQPVIMRWMWINIIINSTLLAAIIMAVYVFALHIFNGDYLQDNIVSPSRTECTIWDEGYTTLTCDDSPTCSNLDICKTKGILYARTTAFISLVFSENMRAYTSRSFEVPVFVGTFSNTAMQIAIGWAQIALYLGLFVPGLNTSVLVLDPYGIKWYGWVLALCGAAATLIACEIYKVIFKHYLKPEDTGKEYLENAVARKDMALEMTPTTSK